MRGGQPSTASMPTRTVVRFLMQLSPVGAGGFESPRTVPGNHSTSCRCAQVGVGMWRHGCLPVHKDRILCLPVPVLMRCTRTPRSGVVDSSLLVNWSPLLPQGHPTTSLPTVRGVSAVRSDRRVATTVSGERGQDWECSECTNHECDTDPTHGPLLRGGDRVRCPHIRRHWGCTRQHAVRAYTGTANPFLADTCSYRWLDHSTNSSVATGLALAPPLAFHQSLPGVRPQSGGM